MGEIRSYKDLLVWQRAMNVVAMTYELTNEYPRLEQYTLVRETRRSAISIPSNIAEGKYRSSRKDFKKFLNIAFSSGAELETQIEIAIKVKVVSSTRAGKVLEELSSVMKMLNVLIRRLG